ncbi:tetratricopeptide repeat protein [Candidatus Omnitrophota bacterium]
MQNFLQTNWQKDWFKNAVYIILISCISLLIYFNSLGGDFVVDDINGIQNNTRIHNIGEYFTSYFKWDLGVLTEVVLALIWHVSAGSPFGYHLFNIVIHALCVVLVYVLCVVIFKHKPLAFFSSLIFAIHPIHTEAVSWISGWPYVASSLFCLGIFISYIKIRQSKKYVLLCVLLFFTGLLFSPLVFVVSLMIVAYELFFKRTDLAKKKDKLFLLILLAAVSSISVIVLISIYVSRGTFSRMIFSYRGWSYLVVIIKAFAYYVKILYLPLARGLYHPFALNNIEISRISPLFFVSIFILLFSIYSFFKCRKEFRPVSFGIMWFLVTYLPYSNIIPVCNIVSERYLYLPSVGICIILAALFLKAWQVLNRSTKYKAVLRCIAIATIVLFLSSYATLTLRRNYDYHNIITYWWSNINNFPDGYIVYNNLARTFYVMGDLNNAMAYCYTTLMVDRTQPYVWCNLGKIYRDMKNYQEAIDCYKNALEIDSNYLPAFWALSEIEAEINK